MSTLKRLPKEDLSGLDELGLKLKTYTGELVKPEGVGKVDIRYKRQKCQLPVTVIERNVPTLLGRDWLTKLRLKWDELVPDDREGGMMSLADGRVESIKKEYLEVFKTKLGCLKDLKASMPVKNEANPSSVRQGLSHTL